MIGIEELTTVALADPSAAYGSDDPGADACGAMGYVVEERLISGVACGQAYTTRVLIRRPRDGARQSGIAIVEPMHMEGGRPIWSTLGGHIMRAGHAWLEVACQYAPAARRLIGSEDHRYAAIELMTRGQIVRPAAPGADLRAGADDYIASWWSTSPQLVPILGQVTGALRSGRLFGTAPRHVLVAGTSQTGGVVRRLAQGMTDGELAPAGWPDGLLACNSGGQPMATPVPSIELLAEADLESERSAAGLPGQGRGLCHRQDDSERFRLYEVAGMAHSESRHPRTSRQPPPGTRWSRFPHAEVMAAVLELLIAWVARGAEPPPGRVLATDPESGRVVRDELGHALGGVRSVATDVPRARLQPLGDAGRLFPFGCETPLSDAELSARYGSEAGWARQAGERARQLVAERWLLDADAGSWR